VAQWDDLVIGAKRNVKEITAVAGGVTAGTVVNAVFKSDPYGVFSVTGTVSSSDSLYVGAQDLGANGKPPRELWKLEIADVPDETDVDAGADPAAETVGAGMSTGGVAGVSHGDLIRANLTQKPYGTFTLTGVAVSAPNGTTLLVGSWILASLGVASPYLDSFELLAPAGAHPLAVPPRMAVWPSERDTTPAAIVPPTELQLEIDTDAS
jgi:hypothetical protein